MKRLAALVVVLVLIVLALSQGSNWWTLNVNTPVSSRSAPVIFTVAPGEGSSEISAALRTRGLIRSALAFDLYVRQTGSRGRLQAGDFILNKNMGVPALVAALEHGHANQVAVRLAEGDTFAQMAQAAQAAGIGKAPDYSAAAQNPNWFANYDFLQNRPPSAPANLEGFLFPDTYLLNPGASARDLVKRQLDEFGQQFSPALRAEAAKPTSARPAESIFTIVILASMVEREINTDPARSLGCDVYYNRLAQGIPLGVDATIEYALGKWTDQLTVADLAVQSPYNTRIHQGLPPGPISNPSLASIKACIQPTASDYLFYFVDPHGVTHFSSTDAQFTQQQKQYGLAGQ
ncbi:MAG TPA: endolytic transglycosylase MltG [Candidatus Acidoferrales bacterium]|nr:endolytic transglycosylase MltG [Candidatus Acidoferrales bacterium]